MKMRHLALVKTKTFVKKVMFLVVIARPRFNREGNGSFSGKIGMIPFVTKEPKMK